jgi:hypothetical protein
MHPDKVPFGVDQQGDEAKLANRFLGGVDLAAGTRLAGIGGEDPGLIQSVSQFLWPELLAWGLVGGIASSLCPKPLLPQLILI